MNKINKNQKIKSKRQQLVTALNIILAFAVVAVVVGFIVYQLFIPIFMAAGIDTFWVVLPFLTSVPFIAVFGAVAAFIIGIIANYKQPGVRVLYYTIGVSLFLVSVWIYRSTFGDTGLL